MQAVNVFPHCHALRRPQIHVAAELDTPAARPQLGVDDRASLIFRMEWRPCHGGHFSECSDCYTTSNSQSLCHRAPQLSLVEPVRMGLRP